LFVVLATLKSSKLLVDAHGAGGGEFELSVPVIQGVAGGNVTVSAQTERASRISYEGQNPLVFAFKAMQLFADDGALTTRDWAAGKEYKALPGEEPTRRLLIVDNELVELASHSGE
jgi:hypothetical protein